MTADPADKLAAELAAVNAGVPGASDRLAAAVYDELRAMAKRKLEQNFGRGMAGVTIQPTMLANDTLMRLLKQRRQMDNAGHLFATASRLMMRLLLDYCRQRKAAKRGGGAVRVTLDADSPVPQPEKSPDDCGVDVESLGGALDRLAARDARKADVVRYRVLWGFSNPEIADALGVALATVERDWAFARAWLAKELTTDEATARPAVP